MALFSLCGCALCAGSSVEGGPAIGNLSGQKSTVIATPISGDYRIDVLLDNANSRWNNASAPGTPIEVTYSFATIAPSYGSADDRKGWNAFTDDQKTAQREIFDRLSQVSNITFREVADSATSYGVIRFHNNSQGTTSGGYAYFPDAGGDSAGDVFINSDGGEYLTNITRTSFAYGLMVHEVLHAIGIKHPGNYNAGEPPAQVPGNFLVETEDNYSNSIMSYISFGTQGLQRDFLGPYDLLALQYLYGAKPFQTGNTTIDLGDSSGRLLNIVIDSGGIDTLNASGSTVGVTINLNQGASSSIGKTAAGAAAISNVQIAFGSVIENANGTSLADNFIGNAANNVFRVNGGSDVVDGAAGIDTVAVSSARAGGTVANGTLTYSAGSVSMQSVERLLFSDGLFAFDTGPTGNAGIVFRIYQAAFNRTPDLGGVSFWTNAFDTGTSLQAIAQGFTGSQEFRTIYGASPTNNQIVDTFYKNVLGRPGEPGGINFWVGELNGGRSVDSVLTLMANSDENIARTAPAIADGLRLDASYFLIA
jgi:hypothetical protein